MYQNKKIMMSIILPVYNVDKYLKQCLDSLLKQTYKNFEVIAVNDGSTDNSLNILNTYKNKFDNMTIINQNNKGSSLARNAGIEKVTGEYIYFLDSDDFIENNTLEILVHVFERTKVDFIKFDALPFSDDINYVVDKNEYNTSKYLKNNTVYPRKKFFKAIEKKYQAPVWMYSFKSSILKDNELRFRPNLLHEDELFTPQLMIHCDTFFYLNNQFFHRRYRAGSIMTSKKNVTSINNYSLIIEQLALMSKNLGILERRFLINRILAIYYTSCCLDWRYTKKTCSQFLKKQNIHLPISKVIKLSIKRMMEILK